MTGQATYVRFKIKSGKKCLERFRVKSDARNQNWYIYKSFWYWLNVLNEFVLYIISVDNMTSSSSLEWSDILS